jgi:uncharacterized protein
LPEIQGSQGRKAPRESPWLHASVYSSISFFVSTSGLMKPSLALARERSRIPAIASRFKMANPRVFGSTAFGDDHEGSDLDLLFDPLPGATLFDIGGLQMELEALLGVPVEVLTPSDLAPGFREKALATAKAL